jgi:hypothetical protein
MTHAIRVQEARNALEQAGTAAWNIVRLFRRDLHIAADLLDGSRSQRRVAAVQRKLLERISVHAANKMIDAGLASELLVDTVRAAVADVVGFAAWCADADRVNPQENPGIWFPAGNWHTSRGRARGLVSDAAAARLSQLLADIACMPVESTTVAVPAQSVHARPS